MKKLTSKDIIESKGKRKLTMATAYDFYTAKAAEVAGIAEEITKRLKIPVIGIGSGPGCDG